MKKEVIIDIQEAVQTALESFFELSQKEAMEALMQMYLLCHLYFNVYNDRKLHNYIKKNYGELQNNAEQKIDDYYCLLRDALGLLYLQEDNNESNKG